MLSALGLAGNLISDLTVTSSRHNKLFCSDTLVLYLRHVLGCWFLDLVAMSCCAGAGCLGHEGWRHNYEMDTEHYQTQI